MPPAVPTAFHYILNQFFFGCCLFKSNTQVTIPCVLGNIWRRPDYTNTHRNEERGTIRGFGLLKLLLRSLQNSRLFFFFLPYYTSSLFVHLSSSSSSPYHSSSSCACVPCMFCFGGSACKTKKKRKKK